MGDAVVAFRGALVWTALEAVGRLAWSSPYLPELMAQKLFTLIPVWAFTPLFRTFGQNSKYYAFGVMIAAEVGTLTLVGTVLRRWVRRRWPTGGGVSWLAAAVAGPAAAVILVGLLPLLDAGLAGQALPGGPGVTIPTVVVIAGCYATILTLGVSR